MKKILYGLVVALGFSNLYGSDANSDRMRRGRRVCEDVRNLATLNEREAAFDSLSAEDKTAVSEYAFSAMTPMEYATTSISLITRETDQKDWAENFAQAIMYAPTEIAAQALSLSLLGDVLNGDNQMKLCAYLIGLNMDLGNMSPEAPAYVLKRNVDFCLREVFFPLAQLRDILDVAETTNEKILNITEKIQKQLNESDIESARNLVIAAARVLQQQELLQLREKLISMDTPVIQGIVLELVDPAFPYETQIDFALQLPSSQESARNVALRIRSTPVVRIKQSLFSMALQRLSEYEVKLLIIELCEKLKPAEQIEAISELCSTSENKAKAVAALIGAQRCIKDRQTVLITAWRELPKTEKEFLRKELAIRGLTKASAAQKK